MPPRIAVMEDPEKGWIGLCEGPGCGNPPYYTAGWPSKEIAAERIGQHAKEHETGELMEPIGEFNSHHGLVASGDGITAVFEFPESAEVIEGTKGQSKGKGK